jgi:pimeloyl-ACP methyl ester carboxylesterase
MTSAVTRFRTARRAVTDTATAPEDENPAVDAAPSAPALATDDDAPPSTRAGASASSSSASPPAAGENTFVQSIARQGRGETEGVTLDDLLAAKTGGPPRFFSPITLSGAECAMGRDPETKPRMVYVPGLDGTGFAASAQFERLREDFELSCLNVPVGDRSGFDELVQIVCEYLETTKRTFTDTSVTLLGESMGGLIALGVAQKRPDLVDALVLVNPASSFDRSPWPAVGPALPLLPETLYEGLPYALAPILFDPPRLLEGAVRAAAAAAGPGPGAGAGADALATPAGLAAAAEELARLFPALGQLSAIIPRDTLAHRLGVLAEGCASVNAPGALERFGTTGPLPEGTREAPPGRDRKKTKSAPLRALVIVSDADALIPSADEGARLARRMPRGACAVETLEGASHAALQESGVDLMEILRLNGFAPRRASDPTPLSKDESFTPPSPKELEKAFDGLNGLRSVVSPVFFSTRDDGTIIPGLAAVPFEENRPVLLVGNHQTIAPDLGFIIEAFIKERGVLPRGLAHPVVAGGGGFGAGAAAAAGEPKKEADADANAPLEMPFGLPAPPGALELAAQVRGVVDAVAASARDAAETNRVSSPSQFTAFGAVPVSGKNLYKLLAAGECVLLFPGGVREAFKRKDEKYALFWPSRPEFVRMAARHGAVIVPFAAVGAEDGFDVVADADDVKAIPFGVGEALLARALWTRA